MVYLLWKSNIRDMLWHYLLPILYVGRLKNLLKVSTQTGRNFNCLKLGTWGTSIFHKTLGINPRGLTPKWGTGSNLAQFVHCLTIWQLWSQVNPNRSRNALEFKWYNLWASWASCNLTKKVFLVAASALALPRDKAPGRLVWALRCPKKNFLVCALIASTHWKKYRSSWIIRLEIA